MTIFRIDADGKRTDEEKDEALAAYAKLESLAARLAATDELINSAACGADGLDSRNFRRRIEALCRDNVIAFNAPDTDPDPEPQYSRAA